MVKRDKVEKEERKTGPGGFLAQEKDEEVSVGSNSVRLATWKERLIKVKIL